MNYEVFDSPSDGIVQGRYASMHFLKMPHCIMIISQILFSQQLMRTFDSRHVAKLVAFPP